MNTYGDVDTYKSEGVIEFTLEGRRLTLRPFTTPPNRFYIVFRDASSGSETYEAARFLYADLLEDGTTVLDFNEAYNPPCAFNPYTTLPNSDSGESFEAKDPAGEGLLGPCPSAAEGLEARLASDGSHGLLGRAPSPEPRHYLIRVSVTSGSIRDARRAGKKAAATAMIRSNTVAPANTAGSWG